MRASSSLFPPTALAVSKYDPRILLSYAPKEVHCVLLIDLDDSIVFTTFRLRRDLLVIPVAITSVMIS